METQEEEMSSVFYIAISILNHTYVPKPIKGVEWKFLAEGQALGKEGKGDGLLPKVRF